jgi:hypothetical protein
VPARAAAVTARSACSSCSTVSCASSSSCCGQYGQGRATLLTGTVRCARGSCRNSRHRTRSSVRCRWSPCQGQSTAVVITIV